MNRKLIIAAAVAILVGALLFYLYGRGEFSCYCMTGNGDDITDMATCNKSVPAGQPGGPRRGCMWSSEHNKSRLQSASPY